MGRMNKKDARSVTLQEHLESIAAQGGRARAEQLTPERQSEIGKKAGRVGGKARARALTREQRQEIARKAAVARWGKKP
jgi:general stress protein YciG